MAFVYRADRKINILNKEQNGTYPGEYFNQSSLIKDRDKQSSEFQSNSVRNLYDFNKNNETPGPGSYESNILTYNNEPQYHKRTKSRDIYEAVKNNLMSKEILKFLEKNQNIAFNSRGQRFNYMVEDLEKKKKLPGPGSYSPNVSSLNVNTEYSTILNQNNSSKKSLDYSKNFPTTHSNYRSETIPSKGNLGYEYDKTGLKIMIKNPKYNYSIENNIKNESLIGPGYYNINLKNKDNAINWSKTRDEKNPKYNLIKYKKNLQPLTELEQDYLDNKLLENKKKSLSNTNINKKNEKNPIFKYIMNRRYNMIKKLKNKLEAQKDLIFETTPGPGYYAPEVDRVFFETQNMKNTKNKCFQSTSPRFKTKTLSNLDRKIGPGYYFGLTKPDKVKKNKITQGHLINVNKEDEECSALKISMIKEDYKIPGPGYYELLGTQFPKAISTNNNFGFNAERFKNYGIEAFPGPGHYNWNKDQFTRTARSLPKNNFNNNKKLFTNSKSDLINVKEMTKFTRDKFYVPPIGLYNPYIVTSIDYNNQAKINTFVDKKVVGFGSQEKKGCSFISKDNNKLVGPGIYYKNPSSKTTKQNNAPFNQKENRFDYNEKNFNPGPGSYEINSIDDWNKKSHNILFV